MKKIVFDKENRSLTQEKEGLMQLEKYHDYLHGIKMMDGSRMLKNELL